MKLLCRLGLLLPWLLEKVFVITGKSKQPEAELKSSAHIRSPAGQLALRPLRKEGCGSPSTETVLVPIQNQTPNVMLRACFLQQLTVHTLEDQNYPLGRRCLIGRGKARGEIVFKKGLVLFKALFLHNRVNKTWVVKACTFRSKREATSHPQLTLSQP